MRQPIRTLAAALLAVALTACGSSGGKAQVATAGGTPSSGTAQQTSAMSAEEKMRKFAACMKDNGVDMVVAGEDGGVQANSSKDVPPPRKRSGGQGGAPGAATKSDADPKFKKAIEACRQYEPSGGDLPKPSPEELAKLREFTKCMRDNGVDMPDPKTDNGGVTIELNDGGQAINPDSSTFKKADEACRHLAPGKPGSSVRRVG